MSVSAVSKPAAPVTITRGLIPSATRLALYGPEGVGKTSLTAGFPSPVFLDTEGGSAHLDVARFPRPRAWAELLAAINHLLAADHGFQTLVIDSIDWAEKLLIEEVCRKANKESLEDFGYGKGNVYLAEEFARFLTPLEKLRDRGIHVVLVGHSMIRKFEAPDAVGAYDRFELKLSKQVAALVKEWVDALLFVNFVTKVTEKDGKQRAVGGRERVIHTTHTAAWDAKNRYGLDDKVPCVVASLVPLFIRAAIPAAPATAPAPAPVPAPAAPSSHKSPSSQPSHSAPVLLITCEQVEKLTLYWATLKKTPEDRAKAFAWIGCDSIDLHWNELTAEQADRLIGKLQDQMNRIAEGSTSTAAKAGSRQNGGAR
ncbi:MAG: ATP-binding protein [Opitutus sp.]|nr:ATP-binding protein [Opitutus sp.]MCS6278385.1 ATP-binding protein [Opitutus sp.]MCS6299495.1 ATP-binding protein [Opitutus sp.]